jgi:hypothetical protein
MLLRILSCDRSDRRKYVVLASKAVVDSIEERASDSIFVARWTWWKLLRERLAATKCEMRLWTESGDLVCSADADGEEYVEPWGDCAISR